MRSDESSKLSAVAEGNIMKSRVIVVTGGFGILGHTVSAVFAAQGDQVVRIDLAPKAPANIDGAVDIGSVNLTRFEEAAECIASVDDRFGAVDVLINIAGGFIWQTFADSSNESWAKMFEINATTCINMTKAALPELLKSESARIINIGAGSALTAGAGMGAYAASKEAVHKLTESLAAELGAHRITVNAILPSIIDTPTNRADMPDADFDRWVKPAVIADVITFLASHAARGISGALIPVTNS